MKHASSSGSRVRSVASGARIASAASASALAAAAQQSQLQQPNRTASLRAAWLAGLALLVAISLISSALVAGSAHAARRRGGSFHGAAAAADGADGATALPSSAASSKTAAGPGPGAALIAAQVVFRHGARTPLATDFFRGIQWACDEAYPGAAPISLRDAAGGAAPPPLVDGASPALPGGCPRGTLTRRGFEMAQQLGRDLRRRYVDEFKLLPPALPPPLKQQQRQQQPDEQQQRLLRLHTTMYRRTVATLRGVLAGLYPPAASGSGSGGSSGGSGGGGGAPFVVEAARERWAFLYPSNGSCPAVGPIVADLAARADARGAREIRGGAG